ncbi:MAG: DNA repair protein RecN [Chloroflexota bacterium]
MLTELTIENFAIIERLQIRCSGGLTVLTGETGAGKSIIIDALQAALGARVPSGSVRDNAEVAFVEAVFQMPSSSHESSLHSLLDAQGIPADDNLILRREISRTGRSVARLNGRAVPLSVMASAGSLLVDIHGQSDHLSILRQDKQLEVLDRYGHVSHVQSRVADSVREYERLRRRRNDVARGQLDAEQRLNLLRFQVDEIEGADLRFGEEEELLEERTRLMNGERLTLLSESASEALIGDTGSADDALGRSVSFTRELSALDNSLSDLHERLQATAYEIQDIAYEVRKYRDAIEVDPVRLTVVEERLQTIARLKRKYGPDIGDVIQFGVDAKVALTEILTSDERLSELERSVEEAASHAASLALQLSGERAAAAQKMMKVMRVALEGLGLKGTEFIVTVSQVDSRDGLPLDSSGRCVSYDASGIDTIAYLVSFNPGEQPKPMERVASGGETSRFLLALKSVLAEADQIPTLVFDEVDVGVGARNGMVVGERLRLLSQTHQVLSITHLPQIAAVADQHITVAKEIQSGRTVVSVRTLEKQDRVIELAAMMGGTGTETGRKTAEELLESASREH